ncbi:hypothetical protein [uncultured Gammaproteobacteria bacterium]|nr:hypothetical protein [uncultured Gammaproteobacteria bacterium]
MENKPLISISEFHDLTYNEDGYKMVYEAFYECMETKKCQKLIDLIPEIDKRNIWYASAFIASVYGSEDNYGGFGFKYNRKKAIYWHKKVFDNFYVIDIGVNLAPLYMLDKEYKNAYKIYQILSTINDHVALTALGNLYRNGFYVTKDLNKALDYYQKAFKHGNLTAPIRTAGIYRQQGKYLKSLILLIKTIINRYTAVFNENKDAGEIFREI